MTRLMDFLTGKQAAERRAQRDKLNLEADLAVDLVSAEAEDLRRKRQALEGLIDDLTERRRGTNA